MTRRRLFLLALLLLAAGGMSIYLLTGSLRSAPLTIGSGTPGRDLALMSDRDGSWDIFLLAGDGTLTALTPDDAAHDYFPSWALDGGQINFLSNRLNPAELGPSQVNADGSNLQNLDVLSAVMSLAMSRRFDWDPAWSPEGGRLLWSSLRDLNLELYLIDLSQPFDIASATRLTDSGARDWFAAWSPDGTRITRAADTAGNEDLYLYDLASGRDTRLTDSPWDDLRAAWALDGSDLLYIADENDALLRGQITLYRMQPDGSDRRPAGDTPFTGGAVWSPDGRQVAYMDNAGGEWQIIVMDVDGSNRRRVTPPGANYLYPVWRP
ncbi:MAG: hypothetical protein MUE40_04795 [Anaerolineae bacterium]|nr:hypothetical protein [Anaerolineae bacterium]